MQGPWPSVEDGWLGLHSSLTSDHIPDPEFQPPMESSVFSLGFCCFRLLNLEIVMEEEAVEEEAVEDEALEQE